MADETPQSLGTPSTKVIEVGSAKSLAKAWPLSKDYGVALVEFDDHGRVTAYVLRAPDTGKGSKKAHQLQQALAHELHICQQQIDGQYVSNGSDRTINIHANDAALLTANVRDIFDFNTYVARDTWRTARPVPEALNPLPEESNKCEVVTINEADGSLTSGRRFTLTTPMNVDAFYSALKSTHECTRVKADGKGTRYVPTPTGIELDKMRAFSHKIIRSLGPDYSVELKNRATSFRKPRQRKHLWSSSIQSDTPPPDRQSPG